MLFRSEDVLKSLQEGGLIIGGHDYTAVAVYLENNGTALDPNKDYAFYKADTEFDATNATVPHLRHNSNNLRLLFLLQ